MESVILVDEHDNELGIMEKMDAHRLGMLHRAFSVILVNDENELLLQKRADTKYHSPGQWSNTCCSHPRPGEAVTDAARRRLMEEMGIECNMKPIFSFVYNADLGDGLFEHEYDHVFLGQFTGVPKLNPAEVSDWTYLSPAMLNLDLKVNPERYTYWFKILFKKLTIMGINQLLLT